MKFVFVLIFVTIPSLIYSVTNWIFVILLMPFMTIQQLITGKKGSEDGFQRMAIGSIFLQIISPLFLILVVPFILYKAGWLIIALIFGVWMLIYFIVRRWSGVQKRDDSYFQAIRQAGLNEKEKE